VAVGPVTNIFYGGGGEYFSSLKVPRQCQLVRLVTAGWREDKALGSEEVKALRSERCYEQNK
jgi:hypothetical protein